jgi:hypothetical protein
MKPSNHLDETKSTHEYVSTTDQYGTVSRSYQPAEYEHQEYPKHVVIAGQEHIARDADHEAQLRKDHEPKVAEESFAADEDENFNIGE